MTERIAIVGAACRYPDAPNLEALWETILAQRQAFRRIPPERLPLDDYYDADPRAIDRTYCGTAALITDWEFDRRAYRVPRAVYDSTDIAHWLALDVATTALADAGFTPPAETTGIVVGNTLTGDGSRAASLRLRWPYVRRILEGALAGVTERAAILGHAERSFLDPMPATTEDTLAGGLSNTIAGRICNYYDFRGGGYTVDGACASSLLAVIQACNAIASGDLDAALAGGVDVSLDPFELVGFAKCSALARERMWVYDRKSNGFLPGEGCGFVVLMREAEALQRGLRVYASILGWGISSDGHGGMTRPEPEGEELALRRAYAKAGLSIGSITYFEGHGTGTPIGDAVELRTIASLLREAGEARPKYIGSIKANIGHTKAAAGIAGLLKAMLVAHHGIVPPLAACDEPRDELAGEDAQLRAPHAPLPWLDDGPRRTAVSAFGFGGINTHVVLESERRNRLEVTASLAARQDAELFLFGAATADEVMHQISAAAARAAELSLAEMSDLAVSLNAQLHDRRYRAAVVAATPAELEHRLRSVRVIAASALPRIALLFPGQASPVRKVPGAWATRFPDLHFEKLFDADLQAMEGTAAAQLAIAAASLAATRMLGALRIESCVAIGHSVGELSALQWGGVLDPQQMLDLARLRGAAMQRAAGDSMLAAAPLRCALQGTVLQPLQRRVVSTVTGCELASDTDLVDLLIRQLTAPVLFAQAVAAVENDVDLFVEAGPGSMLTSLLSQCTNKPAIAMDACAPSLRPLLECAAAAFELGCDVDTSILFNGRFARPLRIDKRPLFIGNACGVRSAAAERKAAPVETAAAEEDQTAASVLRRLIAQQLDLPQALVRDDMRLLADLHLNSITVARILADAARQLGTAPPADPTLFANATVVEAAAVLDVARSETVAEKPEIPHGIEDWVRAFRMIDIPMPLLPRHTTDCGPWRILGAGDNQLQARFARVHGSGTIIILPNDDDARTIDLLLRSRDIHDGERLVIVQSTPRGSAFARSLHLERPSVSVRVVNLPTVDVERIAAEAEAGGDFCEASYSANGMRFEARAVACDIESGSPPLDKNDLLVVTGGGKGIAFETALHLAETTGVRLALLGRSDPQRDKTLAGNLQAAAHAGVIATYRQADVTDPRAVAAALADLHGVTALLHAAGTNEPALIDRLTPAQVYAAVAPKVDGLRNIVGALNPSGLKLLVTFGSVIARTGMRGDAHYALANEWLAQATEQIARQHPRCRALCIEWSAWSGIGMGERLGTIEAMRRQGIVPMDPQLAVRMAARLIASPPAPRVIVSGRLGEPSTFRYDVAPPLLRFIEQTRVHVPRVEFIADATISRRKDSYIDEHRFRGEALLPAVIGLEAMAQIATGVAGTEVCRIENVELPQPVIVAADGETTIRIASLLREDGLDVAVRSSATQFHFDHFRARFVTGVLSAPRRVDLPAGHVELAPADLYDGLLFHTGRFRRLLRYRVLRATECVAEVAGRDEQWFHPYIPSRLVLGDPGIRDAALHVIQACVPQSVVLPAGIESIIRFASPAAPLWIVHARETSCDADGFVYDVDIAAPDGRLAERWSGLRLHIVGRRDDVDFLAPALWAPFVEREIAERELHVHVATDGTANDAMRAAVGHARLPVRRRGGKPLARNAYISASHAGPLTLAVAGARPVGCDLQAVDGHPWDKLLGTADAELATLSAKPSREDARDAAARVWSARESLKKLSGNARATLLIEACGERRRVTFRSGRVRIDTFLIRNHVLSVAHQTSSSRRSHP